MFNVKKNEKRLLGQTFIDLFCGIGGFHLALSSYGARCVFSSEIDGAACDVYQKNFGVRPAGDIRKIRSNQIPKHDILCAGFPCQAFSISGKLDGFKDPNGKLFFEVIRIAKYHKPKMIMLENVKNIQTHNDGKTLKRISEELNKIGYKPFSKVLNATNFGVPQARKRLYIVAFRDDLNINDFAFPERKGKVKSLEDILIEQDTKKYIITREYKLDLDIERATKKSSELVRIGKIGKGRQGERIYSAKGQSITLSSQGGGLGGKTGMYYVNGNVRKLTPRECAHLMGFPNKYKISELESECYKQFGNSVVVNVLQEIIARASKKIIKEGERNG